MTNTRNTYRALFLGVLSVLSALLTFLAGEVSLRWYQRLWQGVPFFAGSNRWGRVTPDHTLGWRATENYIETRKSLDGTEYALRLSQNEYGFRMFGNLHSRKPRVLVVGDSYTHAAEVSDDKTYYAILKNSLDLEVFAYGGGGYGTLQEYMVLDKYFDLVKPDLILWQYCTNDFVNNSPELETQSKVNNNGMVRPYWVDGHIEYILPKKYGKRLRKLALEYSRFLYFTISRLDRIMASYSGRTVEADIKEQGWRHQGFLNSVNVTDELMEKVKKRVGQVPIVAFVAGLEDPYGQEYEDAFKQISSRYNITLLDNVESSVIAAEKRGVIVKAEDGAHWNEAGHRIAGEAITGSLKNMCLLNLCNTVKAN